MKQLTVAVSSDADADVLYAGLHDLLKRNEKNYHAEITRSHRHLIELRFVESDHINNNIEISWTMEVAHLISMFIVNHKESLIIRKIILKQHNTYEEHELSEIMQYCKQLLMDTEACLDSLDQGRCTMISNQLAIYLQSNSHIDVEGFVHFRLKKYMNDLQDVIDDARNEFLLNEQYQEFIALLKYFVYFQDTKIPEVHLIHQGNNKFQLLDGNLQQLDISESRDVIVETIDRELNYEDMVVSALISASPKQIHIHTRDPETQSIKTIQQIFEGRTLICNCCKLCKPSLGEWQAERLT
ncbi:MAG: putative sporulation protein YtxC [Paenibacillaceae bacterium]